MYPPRETMRIGNTKMPPPLILSRIWGWFGGELFTIAAAQCTTRNLPVNWIQQKERAQYSCPFGLSSETGCHQVYQPLPSFQQSWKGGHLPKKKQSFKSLLRLLGREQLSAVEKPNDCQSSFSLKFVKTGNCGFVVGVRKQTKRQELPQGLTAAPALQRLARTLLASPGKREAK